MAAPLNFCSDRHCEHRIPVGHNASSDLVLYSLSILSGGFYFLSFLFSFCPNMW